MLASVGVAFALAARCAAQPNAAEVTVTEPILASRPFNPEIALEWPQGRLPRQGQTELFCRALYNGEEISRASAPLFDADTGVLTTTASCGEPEVGKNGMATVNFELAYDAAFTEPGTGDVRLRAIPGGVTVLPPLVAVVLAIATRNVLVALFAGVWTAAFFIHSYDPFRGFLRSIDTYVLGAFADEDHIYVILFSWFLSGITGLVQRSGGAQGLANAILKYAKTRKWVMFACFMCGLAIFFDDYANTLIVGSTFRPIMDQMLISREKLAFLVDATSAPIASISPISSWIGFELSQISDSYDNIESSQGVDFAAKGWETSPYLIFLRTIPGRFYPIAMLALQAMLILTQRDFGTMFAAERRVLRTGKVHADSADPEQVKINPDLENKGNLPPRLWNALLPILSVVVLVFLGLILTGVDAAEADEELEVSIETVFGQGNTYASLLWATFAVSIGTWVLLRLQYYAGDTIYWLWQRGKRKAADAKPLMRFKESEDTWLEGIKQLLGTTLVLILAWAIGDAMQTLGTDDFIAAGVSDAVDARAIPVLVFILSALISLSTGTSWGTMSIMFPIATQAAYRSKPNDQGLMLSTIASILSGSVFGDHVTPISDTTILSSLATRCDLMHHVKTQAPYALFVGGISTITGDLLSGYLYPDYVGLLITVAVVLVAGFFLSARPDRDGKQDVFTKIFGCCCGRGDASDSDHSPHSSDKDGAGKGKGGLEGGLQRDSDGPEDRPSGVYSATDNSLARAPPPRPGVDLPQALHGVPDANTVPPTGVTATGPPAPAV